jgi:hypothetical protein
MTTIPTRLAVMTAGLFAIGGVIFVGAHSDQQSFHAMQDHGIETMANIVQAFGKARKPGSAPGYLVELSWVDKLGKSQSYPPTHVSAEFWRTIVTNDVGGAGKTKIRYLEGQSVRPIIIADVAERESQDRFGVFAGAAFLAAGFISGYVLFQKLRGF